MPIGNLFSQGGVVMYPLLGLSILAMALILERILFWSQIVKRQDKVVRDVLGLYRRSSKAALQKLEQNVNLPIARIFLAALELGAGNSRRISAGIRKRRSSRVTAAQAIQYSVRHGD